MNSWTVHDICQFLSSVTWWQQKCHVRLNLPPVTRQTIECSNNQSIGYAHLVRAIRARVNNHQETSSGRRSHRLYDTWLLKIAAIDISLVPLAAFGTLCQQGRHHSESNTVESFVATLGTSLYDSSVRTLVNSWSEGNITCSICMDVMERPTLTPCHHMFCFECIQSSYQHDMDHKCPLCRTAAGTKCLKELTMDNVEETVGDMWYTSDISGKLVQLPMVTKGEIFNDCLVPSSKFKTVLDMIDKNGKTVIFYTVSCCLHSTVFGIIYTSDTICLNTGENVSTSTTSFYRIFPTRYQHQSLCHDIENSCCWHYVDGRVIGGLFRTNHVGRHAKTSHRTCLAHWSDTANLSDNTGHSGYH